MSLLFLFGGGPGAAASAGSTIEFGFGSTWTTAPGSITWTDITEYVLQPARLNTNRGASSARGLADVGTCSFSLLNSDRRFDPTYTAGPHYGDLKPGVPVRVRLAPEGGSSAAIFRGHVASWPQRYDLGNTYGFVPIQAYDGFDKVARAKIPRSVLEKEILADSPVAYWPLNEESGSSIMDSSGSGHVGTYYEVELGQDPVVEGLGAATEFANHSGSRGLVISAPVATAYPWSAEATILIPELTEDQNAHVLFWHSVDATSSGYFALYVASEASAYAGQVAVALVVGGVAAKGVVTDEAIDMGEPHHLACVINSASDWQIWIDGVQAPTFDLLAGTPSWPTNLTWWGIGNHPGLSKGDYGLAGTMNALAVYGTDVAPSHADAALAPLDGQTTDERIDWILDEIGWPAGLVDLEVGQSTLGPATFKPGDKALDYLRLIEASEDGRLFITADGTLRFLDRYWRFTATEATVSQFTFSDTADPDESGYAEFQLDLDDELLVNTARYSRRGGTEQVATDQASVDEYGEAESQKSDLLLRTDNEVLSLAEWTVATSSVPQPRCPTIRVPLHRYTAAAADAVLALDLGYRVSVERTPQGVGDPIELDLIVDGISHDYGSGEWWVTLFVSPVPDATLTPFRWDVSEWDGSDAWAY